MGGIKCNGTATTSPWKADSRTYYEISRLSISGSAATVVSVTQLKGPRFAHQTWIVGNRVIVQYSTQGPNLNKIGLWRYPKSGKVVVKFGDFGQTGFTEVLGVTLSVAPSGSHIRQ